MARLAVPFVWAYTALDGSEDVKGARRRFDNGSDRLIMRQLLMLISLSITVTTPTTFPTQLTCTINAHVCTPTPVMNTGEAAKALRNQGIFGCTLGKTQSTLTRMGATKCDAFAPRSAVALGVPIVKPTSASADGATAAETDEVYRDISACG